MRYAISFVVILYAISAVIDAIIGINTLNLYESYMLRVASATAIIAICIHIVSKGKRLRPLPFILASVTLSIVALILGPVDWATILNMAIKIVATILTVKPDMIELEVETITEKVEKS